MKKVIFISCLAMLISCKEEPKNTVAPPAVENTPTMKVLVPFKVKSKSLAPLQAQDVGAGGEGRAGSKAFIAYKVYLETMDQKEEIVYVEESHFNMIRTNDTIFLAK